MTRSGRAVMLVLMVALAVWIAGCTSTQQSTNTPGTTPAAEKGPIRIGSKIDVEGPVLGNIIAGVLANNGFKVEDKMRTGATPVVRKALLAGEIDIYPEYTANAVLIFLKDQNIDPSVLKDAAKTYQAARDGDLKANNVVWLKPAPANNTWGVAVPKAFAEANGIKTFEDWAAFINRGTSPVKVVGSQEFFSSPAAMPAFERAYGFKLKADQIVALATGDTAVTEKAAAQGTDGANAAMAYGTDPTIAPLNLVFLTDSKSVQPYYQPAPTVRREVYEKYPELSQLLDPVFATLDLETLQKLNGQVAVEGKDPKAVATAWLTEQGFLK
jgi:osmoprotectant transport system substrate-binding protein